MECPPSLEPAYLNLPGWRCVPVYAVPLSPKHSPTSVSPPPLEAHTLLPPNIPSEPRQWSRQHVSTWLEWCIDYFALPPLDRDKFLMNGRGLCLLRHSDFWERAPRCGDVLHNALRILLRDGTAPSDPVPLPQLTLDKGNRWSRSVSSDFHSVGHVIHENDQRTLAHGGSDVDSTTAPSPPSPDRDVSYPITNIAVKMPQIRQLAQLPEGGTGNSTEKINVRLLWDFLQQLLNDPQRRFEGCIVWKQRERGVFRITDPQRLAALWGRQKNHLNMNFDKMSRALRYYYRVRILQKEPGERHCYRFLRHPNELRHCKQRSLLMRNHENITRNGLNDDNPTIEAALDMSIKEEGTSPDNAE